MAKIAIVSTSINTRPAAYEKWASADDCTLIVAGDRNTPPILGDYVSALGGVYLTPAYQEFKFAWSDLVGWNCIQRRNTAIMYALREGFDYILTVDDDNHPVPDANAFVKGHLAAMGERNTSPVITSRGSNFLNTGMLCTPQFHQRGVPYGVSGAPTVYTHAMLRAPHVVVSQAQVLGDPDCDAVERMCNAPDVVAVNMNAVVFPGVMAAFNSQATMWNRAWAPVMACLPGIGRYDDIFASYLFARLGRTYQRSLYVGEPCVVQKRNDHDLVKDLRAELWGMNNVFTFVGTLENAHIGSDMPIAIAYGELIFAAQSVLPQRTVDFANAWVKDWRSL